MEHYVAWFLLIAPLVATIAILLHLHRKPDMAIFASVGSAALCFLIALAVAFGGIQPPTPFEWISLPGCNVDIGMIFDPLSKGMLLVVTGVGLLVHIFSIGYMAHDPGKGRFFGGLSIFMFSMTGIVLADNLIMMFLFWEGVGLSSYLLIGFWYEKESAAAGRQQGLRLQSPGRLRLHDRHPHLLVPHGHRLGQARGSGRESTSRTRRCPGSHSILTRRELARGTKPASIATAPWRSRISPILLTIMVLGLFCGCVGKSAMFPLHVWLPDAMEGPTPVSALIHAATMVAAGVYMLCRVYPLLLLSPVGHVRHRLDRLLHRHLRRAHRRPAKRHQAHPRLLDALAARLHGHGRRLRRARCRDVPPHHPRLLQGAPLPRRRLGHPRAARRAGHLENGRPLQQNSAHLLDLRHRHARAHRLPALRRILQQGLRPLRRLRLPSRLLLGRRHHRVPHRLLHDAPRRRRLLRPGPHATPPSIRTNRRRS